ncbi:MAG: GTP-binding protein [Spirochaetaceae bacterium]|nr:GTP-binding protein [Spirochaetaceae bacterium]
MNSPPGRRRNIGILAHIDAGKTSMTERLLFLSGRIREAGDIESGTTTTDYLAVERERGITVKAAAARLDWRDARISLIDTPGHVDFGAEVERSLRALDGAVLLVCGVAGVQSRTETVFRALERRGAPRLAFLNKMDRKGASFTRVLGELRALAGPRALAVQLPWGEGESFHGVIDVLSL